MTETVGFTGTQNLSTKDYETVRSIVLSLPSDIRVVVGGCIGVDDYVAYVAFNSGYHVHAIIPFNRSKVAPDWRDYCTTYEEMPEGTDYRDRNTRIVEEVTDRLIAIAGYPENDPQSRRSGTWMTVRIARRANKLVEEHVLSEVVHVTT